MWYEEYLKEMQRCEEATRILEEKRQKEIRKLLRWAKLKKFLIKDL